MDDLKNYESPKMEFICFSKNDVFCNGETSDGFGSDTGGDDSGDLSPLDG